ncbi:hypothetical protein F4776DRAFT_474283 [Hypoxylon sp. NC0597]|nr:hypothetical protein F4776DRAFT_474283 [Hypoxylon sp. NC0597]
MEVNLDSVEHGTHFTASERPIFNVLKATLQYPGNQQAKIEKLTNDIIFFCKSSSYGSGILWNVWSVVIEIILYIPPDHPWQECFIQCLSSLRQRDDTISSYDQPSQTDLPWADLPNLSYCMREKWLDPTDDDEALDEEVAKWKNLNSFVARVTATGFAPWLTFPFWQLRTALEEPPVKGLAMNCRLWVACEWVIHCAGIISEEMNSIKDLDESLARSLSGGSLYDGKELLGTERWEFWKRRFSEINADAGKLGLDTAVTKKVVDALKKMDEITIGGLETSHEAEAKVG